MTRIDIMMANPNLSNNMVSTMHTVTDIGTMKKYGLILFITVSSWNLYQSAMKPTNIITFHTIEMVLSSSNMSHSTILIVNNKNKATIQAPLEDFFLVVGGIDVNFAPHTWQNLAPSSWSVSLQFGHFITYKLFILFQ